MGTNSFLDTARNQQSTANRRLVDSVSLQKKSHALKFGADYRRLTPAVAPPPTRRTRSSTVLLTLSRGSWNTTGYVQLESAGQVPLILEELQFVRARYLESSSAPDAYLRPAMGCDFTPKTSSGPSLPAVVNFNDFSTLALALLERQCSAQDTGTLVLGSESLIRFPQRPDGNECCAAAGGYFRLSDDSASSLEFLLSFWQQQLRQSCPRWSIPVACFCCSASNKCREHGYRGFGSRFESPTPKRELALEQSLGGVQSLRHRTWEPGDDVCC